MDKSTPDPRPHAGRPDAAPAPQSEQDAPPGFLSATFASLAYRNFVYLWLGQVTHAGALWIDMVARPLLVLAVTDSAIHLGLVMSARTIPAIALGLFAGVLADNFNRRMMLLATKVIVFGFGTLFALLLFFGLLELWHIYLFTFLRGATQAFDQPARRALVPSAVPRHLVTNAMALSSGTVQIMRIAGAGAAGVIIAGAGIEVAFLVIAALYGAAVYATWMLRTPDHRRQAYRGVGGIGADFVQGLKYGWNDRVVRGILIISAGYFTFGMAFMQVFAPLFAKRVLDIGDSGFGWMMAITGAGGVVGAFMLAGLNPRTKRGQMTTALLGILGLLLVAFALSTYWGPVALVFALVGVLGLAQSWFIPMINSVLLETAPDQMRGRVVGLLSLDRAMSTLGAAGAGFLAAAVGAQQAQLIFGACCVATAVAMFVLYPAIRRVE